MKSEVYGMKRFKLSWRMGLEVTTNPQDFEQMLDLMTTEGTAGDEFWIFISEPTSHAYEPLEEVRRKCDMYKIPAAAARKRGLRVGINPWPTFGAGEVYQADLVKREMPFQPMVGYNGEVATRVACPISPEFLKYSQERYKAFARSGVDFVWVDDDCRLTHLGGAPYPCFCPRCVRGFEGGKFADRETLVAALNAPENEDLRRKWSAYGAQRLATYCKAVREAVDEVDPAIETPFMSVGYSHTTFSGDYIEQCMKVLRAKGARPGHGFYWDEKPMGMFDKVIEMSRQVANMPEDVLGDVQYEEESCPGTPLNKAANTRLMEAALAIWGGCTGIAMNHMYHAGGPAPFEYLRYETDQLKANRPFYDRYLTFVDGLKQSGIWAAYSEWMAAGMKVDEKGWFHESDPAYSSTNFVSEWPTFGIPCTCDARGAYATLIQGKMAHVFTDEELTEIFKKPVIVDGAALEALWERGWGEKTGVKITGSALGGAEKLADSAYIGDFAGNTRSAIYGTAYDLEPIAEGVEVLGYTERPLGQADKIALTKYNNVIVLGYNPYQYTGTPGRLLMMRNLQKALGASVILEPAQVYACPRVSTWVRADVKRAAVLLINAETAPALDFDVCFRTNAATKAAALGLNKADETLCVRREDGFVKARITRMEPWEMKLILID